MAEYFFTFGAKKYTGSPDITKIKDITASLVKIIHIMPIRTQHSIKNTIGKNRLTLKGLGSSRLAFLK